MRSSQLGGEQSLGRQALPGERRGGAPSGFEASEQKKGSVNLPGEKLNLSATSLRSAVVKLSVEVGSDRLS